MAALHEQERSLGQHLGTGVHGWRFGHRLSVRSLRASEHEYGCHVDDGRRSMRRWSFRATSVQRNACEGIFTDSRVTLRHDACSADRNTCSVSGRERWWIHNNKSRRLCRGDSGSVPARLKGDSHE